MKFYMRFSKWIRKHSSKYLNNITMYFYIHDSLTYIATKRTFYLRAWHPLDCGRTGKVSRRRRLRVSQQVISRPIYRLQCSQACHVRPVLCLLATQRRLMSDDSTYYRWLRDAPTVFHFKNNIFSCYNNTII